MTNLADLVRILKDDTKWQKTPEELDDAEYFVMILQGVETLFIDTGRALMFDDIEKVNDDGLPYIDYDFKVDERKYILLCAQITFLKRVQTDVNNIVSYSTDALTVTNADKPYGHIADSIANLERERRRLYYKMVRYTI